MKFFKNISLTLLLIILILPKTDQDNNIQNETNRILPTTICDIKYCLLCGNRNECEKCQEGYQKISHRCYSKNCRIYGFCKYCDEYDCLKCEKGYKLEYGLCDKLEEKTRKKLMIIYLLIIVSSFILLILLFYYTIRYCKYKKHHLNLKNLIKYKRINPGNYVLFNDEKNIKDSVDNNMFCDSGVSIKEHSGDNLNRIIMKKCSLCSKPSINYTDCGCGLCSEHWKTIIENKNNKKYLCAIHRVYLEKNLHFKLNKKTHYKGNALDKLGLTLCPICKTQQGTTSFGCGCTMKVCPKCYNDYVYVFKNKVCPGCGQTLDTKPNSTKSSKRKLKRIVENNKEDNKEDNKEENKEDDKK